MFQTTQGQIYNNALGLEMTPWLIRIIVKQVMMNNKK